MPTLQLSSEEAKELHTVLEVCFSELRMEIELTESGAFRSQLQKREQLIKKLIDELER
jgi:hypothetical protein